MDIVSIMNGPLLLTQVEAAQLLDVSERTIRRYLDKYETEGLEGLFCSFYSDRGTHYWYTPEVGDKVDKYNLTQFGLALQQLDIAMIPSYSPEARGRSEWAFRTHQKRLPKELAKAGITDIKTANRYIQKHYLPAFNKEFRYQHSNRDLPLWIIQQSI